MTTEKTWTLTIVGQDRWRPFSFQHSGISVRWNQLTVANCSCPNPSSSTPRILGGLNSSRQTRDQLAYSWFLVWGWDWGQDGAGGGGRRDKEREKLAGRFWKAVTFLMMSAFPITALTRDPGRWFNGGILFLLTSPFSPPIKTENTELGLGLCGKCGQAAKIYYSSTSSPISLSHWFRHSVGVLQCFLR